MIISFKRNSNKINLILSTAGYVFRPVKNDWIREVHGGRFHAIVVDQKTIEIHYDLYVEWRHVSGFYLPEKHNKERKRIYRAIKKVIHNKHFDSKTT